MPSPPGPVVHLGPRLAVADSGIQRFFLREPGNKCIDIKLYLLVAASAAFRFGSPILTIQVWAPSMAQDCDYAGDARGRGNLLIRINQIHSTFDHYRLFMSRQRNLYLFLISILHNIFSK
jgi:hypothetical protein